MGNYIADALVRNRMKRLQESKGAEYITDDVYRRVEGTLNHSLGLYESGASVEEISMVSKTDKFMTVKVKYSVDIRIPIVDPEDHSTYYETDTEYRTRVLNLEM